MTLALLMLLGATDPATGFSIMPPLSTPCVYRPEPHLGDTCPPNHAVEQSDDPPWLYASDNDARNTVVISTIKLPGVSRATKEEVDQLVGGIAHDNPRTIIEVGGLPVVRFTGPPPGPGWAPQEVAFLPVKDVAYLLQVSSKDASARPLFDTALRTVTVPRDVVFAARAFNHDPADRTGRNIGTGVSLGVGALVIVFGLRWWLSRQKTDR